VRLVIIDSSLGWLGQRCSAQLGSWLLAVGSQLVAPSPIPGSSQRRAWPSTTEPPKGTSEHHWHHHRGYVSSHLIARRAYVDLLVDFYMKLSYLSYNYETTWLRIRVRVFLIQQLSDPAIQLFSHMNRSLSGPTLTPIRFLGHRRVRVTLDLWHCAYAVGAAIGLNRHYNIVPSPSEALAFCFSHFSHSAGVF